MTSVPFDTLKAYQELQNAGFDDAQARAVIATVGTAIAGILATKHDVRDMATKEDIKDMATKQDITDMATKDDIREMATKSDIRDRATKQDIADVRREMATKDEVAGVGREMATKADVHALEVRLMVRLGGMIIAATGITIAAIRLLS